MWAGLPAFIRSTTAMIIHSDTGNMPSTGPGLTPAMAQAVIPLHARFGLVAAGACGEWRSVISPVPQFCDLQSRRDLEFGSGAGEPCERSDGERPSQALKNHPRPADHRDGDDSEIEDLEDAGFHASISKRAVGGSETFSTIGRAGWLHAISLSRHSAGSATFLPLPEFRLEFLSTSWCSPSAPAACELVATISLFANFETERSGFR